MKKCTSCGKIKPLTEFHVHKQTRDGLRSKCKECRKIDSAKYLANNRDEILVRKLVYREKHRKELVEKQKEYYREHVEDASIYNKRYREENKELIIKQKNLYHIKNKDKITANVYHWKLHTRYNLTQIEYDELLEFQNNGCAVCGKSPKENGKRLAVDHSHVTGEVRGLLCISCNLSLGRLGDELESALNTKSNHPLYDKMIQYLTPS